MKVTVFDKIVFVACILLGVSIILSFSLFKTSAKGFEIMSGGKLYARYDFSEIEDKKNIEISTDCTACAPNRFWSHRVTRGKRGSQAGVIECREENA